MKASSSKSITIRESNSYPNALSNTSQCSCPKCDSNRCFKLRNKNDCYCAQCGNFIFINHSQTEIDNKSSHKTVKIDICGSDTCMKERVKHEIDYEKSNLPADDLCSTCEGSISFNKVFDKISMERKNLQRIHRDMDTNTAKLSALIMNLPYKDFKESISYSKREITPKTNKLTSIDIFKRIRDAYKACSCKVCECIVSKPVSVAGCNCTPCECKDCESNINKFKQISTNVADGGCPCIRCDRKGCKGLTKKGNLDLQCCDCDPRNAPYSYQNYSEPCKCKPCECIDCKFYSRHNTFTIGRVVEDVPQERCTCSPCECAECAQTFTLASSLRHEMSTGISRPANCNCDSCLSQSCETDSSNQCTCDVQKQVMRKPFEKDTRDFDIHRASVVKNNFAEKQKNRDTIAMFASVESSYPKLEQSRNPCFCGDCKCLLCNIYNETANCIKGSTLFEPETKNSSPVAKITCKCSVCVCEVCNENCRQKIKLQQSNLRRSCTCEVCDCLDCESKMNSSSKSLESNKIKTAKNVFSKYVYKCEPREHNNDCLLDVGSLSKESIDREKILKQEKDPMIKTELKIGKSLNLEREDVLIDINHEKLSKSLHNNFLGYKRGNYPSAKYKDQCTLHSDNNLKCEISYKNNYSNNKLTEKDISPTFFSRKDNSLRSFKANVNSFEKEVNRQTNYKNVTGNRTDVCQSECGELFDSQRSHSKETYDLIQQFTDPHSILKKEETYDPNNISGHNIVPSCALRDNDLEVTWEKSQIQQQNMRSISIELAKSLQAANKGSTNNNIKTNQLNKYKTGNSQNDLTNEIKEEYKEKNKLKSNCDLSNNHFDSEKVQNTLKRAKKFSSELKTLLQEFKEANSRFQLKTTLDSLSISHPKFGNIFSKSNYTDIHDPHIRSKDACQLTQNSKQVKFSCLSDKIYENRQKIISQNKSTPLDNAKFKIINDNINGKRLENMSLDTKKVRDSFVLSKISRKAQSFLENNFKCTQIKDMEYQDMTTQLPELNNKNVKVHTLKYVNSVISEDNLSLDTLVPNEVKGSNTALKTSKEDLVCLRNFPKENSAFLKDFQKNVFKDSKFKNLTTTLEQSASQAQQATLIQESTNSYDELKVKIFQLRRVSNHTVLVKWKLPKLVDSVQGYELLVDGQAVQKILSPTRCTAVVSCLPQTKQIPITIRTIVASELQFKMLPSATAVYQPRHY